ncbi:MAG: hypothetical protein ACR2ML_07485 [Solirubrobacteraceae bacterium]
MFEGSLIATSSPFVDEGDGHGAEASGGGGVDQVRRSHVDVEAAQVEVVQPEALGDRLGELLRADLPTVHQHLARVAAGVAGLVDRGLDLLAGGEAHVDDDIADSA